MTHVDDIEMDPLIPHIWNNEDNKNRHHRVDNQANIQDMQLDAREVKE
jgi:hypothetical protein